MHKIIFSLLFLSLGVMGTEEKCERYMADYCRPDNFSQEILGTEEELISQCLMYQNFIDCAENYIAECGVNHETERTMTQLFGKVLTEVCNTTVSMNFSGVKYFSRLKFSCLWRNRRSITCHGSIRCQSDITVKPYRHQLGGRYDVHVLPALHDNYMYVLIDKVLKFAIAVDPVEPEKILNAVASENAQLKAVLTTHHHIDHAGGNEQISEMVKNLPIFGGDERIESLTEKVAHNQTVKLGDLQIKCLHTPCHTSGHLCYFIQEANIEPICFTGDTLFVAGCGRFFEGSASDMFNSLSILSKLPPNTKCYCGHEYTVSNLKFALSVEPSNSAAIEKLKTTEEKLKRCEPSVPTTIGEELSYNPFLRVDKKAVQQYTNQTNETEVMCTLRKFKDVFKS